MAAILAHLSVILLALAGVRAYIHSRDVTLDHVVFLLRALPLFGVRLYSARAYLHHWTFTLTTCNRLPEGRYDAMSNF